MANRFYPGLGALPETLETQAPGRASPKTREEGLAQLREEFRPRPIVDALGPLGRLALGLPMYTSPDQKMLEQRRQMDEITSGVPLDIPITLEDVFAHRAYSEAAPKLGPSASGRAEASPTDTQMLGGLLGRFAPFVFRDIGRSPAAGEMPVLQGRLRNFPLDIEAQKEQAPELENMIPPVGFKNQAPMPILPGVVRDPNMPIFKELYPFGIFGSDYTSRAPEEYR